MLPDNLKVETEIIDPYERIFHSQIEILGLTGKRTFTRADYHRWLTGERNNPEVIKELRGLPPSISYDLFQLFQPLVDNYVEQVEFDSYSIGVQIRRHTSWIEEIDRKAQEAFESFCMMFGLSSSEESDNFSFTRTYSKYPWARGATFFKNAPSIGQYDFFRPIRGKSIEILTKMGSPAKNIVPEQFNIPGIRRVMILPDDITCWIGKSFIPSKKDIINASFDSIRKHLSQTNTFLVNPPQ